MATDPFAPPGFSSASTCRKWHLLPCTHHFSDLQFRHTEGCQNLHDGFLQNLNRHGISLLSTALSCLLPDPFEDVCPSFSSMSLLLNIVHVPSTDNTLPLSSHRRLRFLFWLLVTDPLSTTSLRTWSFEFSLSDRYEVFTAVFNWWWVGSFVRAVSWSYTKKSQSGVERNLPILTCTILPGSNLKVLYSQLIKHDNIWRRNPGRRHSVSS